MAELKAKFIRIDPKLWEQVKFLAQDRGSLLSPFVCQILEAYVRYENEKTYKTN